MSKKTDPFEAQPPPGFDSALSALIESAGIGVFTKDPSGRYTYASRHLERLFGIDLEHIIGASDIDFYDAELARTIREHDLRVLQHGAPFSGIERGAVLSTGETKTFRTIKVPLYDLQHRVIGLCGVAAEVADVTEPDSPYLNDGQDFKHLAGSTLRIEWRTSADGSLIDCTQGWLEYSGLTPQQCYGHRWDQLVHPDDAQRTHEAWQDALKNQRAFGIEIRLRKFDGTYEWWLVSVTPALNLEGTVTKLYGACTNIHSLKIVEQNLQRDKSVLEHLINSIPAQIFAFDLEQRVIFANDAMATFYGYKQNDLLGKNISYFLSQEELKTITGEQDRIVQLRRVFTTERLVKGAPNENPRILLNSHFPLQDLAGNVIGIGAVETDITATRTAERELSIAATVFESSLGTLTLDIDFNILRANSAFTKMTGYSEQEIIGKNPEIIIPTIPDRKIFSGMGDFLKSEGHWEGELKSQRKTGEIFPLYLTATAVLDPQGIATNYVLRFTDYSTKKLMEGELQKLAWYDYLTGLPNRRYVAQHIKRGVAAIHRSQDMGALLFIDIDNFKLLNDSLGHSVGDLLLKGFAKRLKGCVRQGDLVTRLGGDEFLIVLTRLGVQPVRAAILAESVGEKILSEVDEAFSLGSHLYHCTASIGITIFRESAAKFEDLLKQADIAMYAAKRNGGTRIRFFNQVMEDAIRVRAKTESELRKAVKGDQLIIYYQRQVDRNRKTFGAEALLRWNHPTQGIISPKSFIGIAEETNLIIPMSHSVLLKVCDKLVAWANFAETRDLSIAINVSARRFRHGGFVEEVLDTVRERGVDPKQIKFEITEGILLENKEEARGTIQRLKDEGFEFSLDDFGTGYSSLQYLQKLPLGQLKIDQAFIRDIEVDSQDHNIVRAIIAMASSLGIQCVAEGVETEGQLKILLEDGCNFFQGYLFGKPLTADEFETSLRAAH